MINAWFKAAVLCPYQSEQWGNNNKNVLLLVL